MDDYTDLANLLKSYFHQDWDLDCPDEDAVVRHFAQTNHHVEIDRAREQALAFASAHSSNLQAAFDAHFPATIVIGNSDAELQAWLTWLAERLLEYRPLAVRGEAR